MQIIKNALYLPLVMQLSKLLFFILLVPSIMAKAQILPSFGDSRSGSTGMQFLKIAPDARSLSIGGAYVATANDVAAMFWNPAGITAVDTGKINVQVSHTQYFGDISANYIGAVIKAGKNSFLGMQVMSMNYGTMDETTEFESGGTGRTFTLSNYYLGLTYAQILTSNFSFGLNARYANEGFPGVSIHNVLFDLGLKYNIGIKNARFGVNFSNFGINVNPQGKAQILKFTGVTDVSTFSSVTVPGVFRFGGAFDPIYEGHHQLTVAAQLNHPTDNNETYGLGTEYNYKNTFFGRLGYEFASDERYRAPSFGAGIKLKRNYGSLSIDYGFLAKNNLGSLHRITLGICIK